MVTGCDFTSDGKLAVSGTDIDKSVIVWDTSIGQPVLKLPGEQLELYYYLCTI